MIEDFFWEKISVLRCYTAGKADLLVQKTLIGFEAFIADDWARREEIFATATIAVDDFLSREMRCVGVRNDI